MTLAAAVCWTQENLFPTGVSSGGTDDGFNAPQAISEDQLIGKWEFRSIAAPFREKQQAGETDIRHLMYLQPRDDHTVIYEFLPSGSVLRYSPEFDRTTTDIWILSFNSVLGYTYVTIVPVKPADRYVEVLSICPEREGYRLVLINRSGWDRRGSYQRIGRLLRIGDSE